MLFRSYEERLNGFLGENQKENEKQYQILWKKLNFIFIEQFLTLADRYFSQPNWDKNSFVNLCIKEIKSTGFVETNTPIWNSLMGFENSITWYNSTQHCINEIIRVIHREDYFSSNNLSVLTQRNINLTNQNCRQNNNKLSALNNAYENLKNRSYDYLYSKIRQYRSDFNGLDNSSKIRNTYKETAYMKLNEVSNKVRQWNTIFHTSDVLNEQIERYREELNTYYN